MTGYFRCCGPQGNAFIFSKEVWDDLSREGKTTSYLGLESMSGFHSAHDPLAREESGEKRKTLIKRESKPETAYTVVTLTQACVSAQKVMGCSFTKAGLGGCGW